MAPGRELKRTCNKCGTVWHLSTDELKRPGFWELAPATVGFGHHRERRREGQAVFDRWNERVKALARCPQCRSTDHAEEPA
jgi:hypothetical protein